MKTSPPMLIFAIAVFTATVSGLPHGDNSDVQAPISEITFSLEPNGEVRRVPSDTHPEEDVTEQVTNAPSPGLSLDDVVSLTTHQVSSSESISESGPSQGGVQDESEERMLRDTPVIGSLGGDKSDECCNDTYAPLSNFARDLDTDYVAGLYGVPLNDVPTKYDPNVPGDAVEGTYGGFYRDYHLTENGNLHPFETAVAYLHGQYREPTENYYDNYVHNSSDSSVLGYYIGYGLQQLYSQQRIKRFYSVNHYQHQENPYKPQRFTSDRPERQTEYVPPEVTFECSLEARALCPENTETFCFRNGTIVCMSRMSTLRVCDGYPEMSCVDTVVPCIPDSKLCVGNLETVSLPCLTQLVMEIPQSGVLLRVAKTFVVAPQSPVEDRSFCASIIFEPVRQFYNFDFN